MINPDRWQRIKEIVGAALECSADERSAFLERECANDAELRAEADSLIAAYREGDGLSVHALNPAVDEEIIVPRSIGPYRLERELGAGGMGQVWLAEQTQPVRRWVAIKVILAGFHDQRVLKRFLSERQSLALMNHPTIAKIFDAGATADGRPYLVMEYVDGCPITEYCDRHSLPIVERLQLFQLVCDGVQHAHQKAIIHRDLKPSNILVTEVDGKPLPQIIDFGVAKELSGAVDAKTMMTQIGTFVGTLGYMSPEQATLDAQDIDTRSDVYSLGVILYELLVGMLPVDRSQIRNLESLHRLISSEARRPSTKLQRASDESARIARDRGTEIAVLQRELRGDLDSIALKALENDRARRYATPSEFAADIGKYLRNEPVSAHAPSAAYQARKYLRRHWAGAAVAAVVLALLVGFAVTQSIQLREIRLGRDRADQITGFMKQIFKVADPSEARGNSVTAREILDRSSRQIESGVGLDAGEQSELLQVMAETYQNLGLYARAHTLAQAALDSRRRLFGPEDPKTLQSLAQMGNLLFLEGHAAEAEASLRDTVAIELRVLGAQNILTLQTQDALVSNLAAKGRYAEAEKLARQTIALESVTLGPRNLLTLNTTRVLASALRSQNRFAEAEALFRQTALIEQQVLGADHPDTLKTRSSLANLLRLQGRYSEAEDILKDVLASRRRVLGEDHPETADTLTMLAIDLVHDRNRYKEAEELYRTALAIDLRQLGPESRFTTRTEEGLANVLAEQDRYGEAEPLFREVLRVRLKLLGPDATDTLLTERNLGNLMLAEGHLPEAERIFRSTLERDERVLAPDDRDLLGVKSWLAETLLQEHRPAEAEVFARQAFEAEQRVLGAENATTLDGLYRLAHALAALGRYDEAKSLYMGAIDKIASEPKSSPSKAWYDFACLAAMTGHVDDALEGLQHAAALGYKNGDSTDHDENLNPLRRDARFASLIDRIQGSAGSGLPPH